MASKLTAVVSRHSIFQPATITKFADMDSESQRYFEEDVASIEQHWGCRLIDVIEERFRPDQDPRNWGFKIIELFERLAKETTGDLRRAQTLIRTEYNERWRRRVRTAARDTPHLIETDLERAIEAAKRANRSRARKPQLAASARIQKTAKRPRTAAATPLTKADTDKPSVDLSEHLAVAAAQPDRSNASHQQQSQFIPQHRRLATDTVQPEPPGGTPSLIPTPAVHAEAAETGVSNGATASHQTPAVTPPEASREVQPANAAPTNGLEVGQDHSQAVHRRSGPIAAVHHHLSSHHEEDVAILELRRELAKRRTNIAKRKTEVAEREADEAELDLAIAQRYDDPLMQEQMVCGERSWLERRRRVGSRRRVGVEDGTEVIDLGEGSDGVEQGDIS